MGQEVAGLLLAAAFSICQNTACGGLWETPEEMEGPARVKKGQSHCSQILSVWPHTHLTSQESSSAFCQKNNNSEGKKVTSIGVDTGEAGEVPGLQDEGEEAQ